MYDPFVRLPMLSFCTADRNADGLIGVADLADYLNAYASNDCSADLDADGLADQADLLAFLHLLLSGCEDG